MPSGPVDPSLPSSRFLRIARLLALAWHVEELVLSGAQRREALAETAAARSSAKTTAVASSPMGSSTHREVTVLIH